MKLLAPIAALIAAFAVTAATATAKVTPPAWPKTSKCVHVINLIRCTLIQPTGLTLTAAVQKSAATDSPVVKGGRGILTVLVNCDGIIVPPIHKLVAPKADFVAAEIHPALPGLFGGVRRCHIEITGRLLRGPHLNYGVTPLHAG